MTPSQIYTTMIREMTQTLVYLQKTAYDSLLVHIICNNKRTKSLKSHMGRLIL
jgi:hypothetical protein